MRSEHPLADAIVESVRDNHNAAELHQFESITARGVKGEHDGQTFFAGNYKLLLEQGIHVSDEALQVVHQWENATNTVIYFANRQGVLALFAVADKIKSTAKGAVAALRAMGIEVLMLTGDQAQTARAVAGQVGVNDFKAEVLPSQKAEVIQKLQQSGKVVAMVGDGINDSQALAQADVSIAMGKGSDIAMDVAKMTLITSDLQFIPKALHLSTKTVRTIRQNLFWAFIYNLIGIPLAAGVLYPFTGFLLNPMLASAAMALSSVSVVANSLRLKTAKL
jgi:Cu2+-exporting ATPase